MKPFGKGQIFFLTIGVITVSCPQNLFSQDPERSFSFNLGVNLSQPTFIYSNEESFKQTVPGYQFGFNKEFRLTTHLDINLGLGLNKNSFNAGRQVGSVYSIKQIDLSYLSLEAGPLYKISTDRIGFWSALNLRISRIVSENYSDYYTSPTLSSSDVGLNFKIGAKLSTIPMRPYIVFNYYYGLVKIADNSVVTGTGQSLNDYIRNRSIGFQLGFYLL